MKITLPAELQKFVDEKVATGLFIDAADVVREALRRMRCEHDPCHGAEPGSIPPADLGHLPELPFGELLKLPLTSLPGGLDAIQRSARRDVSNARARLRGALTAQEALHELLNLVNRDIAANAGLPPGRPLDLSKGMGDAGAYARARVPGVNVDAGEVRYDEVDLAGGPVRDVGQLRAARDELMSRLDALSEMGEMESLRLQMAMDRLSKFMSTLSNILRKLSETGAGIVGNLK